MRSRAFSGGVLVQRDLTGRRLAPRGLLLVEDAISIDGEVALIREIEEHESGRWSHPILRGQAARREAVSYGRRYDYESRAAVPGEGMPVYLQRVRERCAEAVDVAPPLLEQVLVQRYPPGAGIGAHRDSPAFGEPIVGLSLLGEARLVMRGPRGARFEARLWPRSVYALRREARWLWTHEVPPVRAQRMSLTFRALSPEEMAGR